MDSGRSEYSETERCLALQRMQRALKVVRRPTRLAVAPRRECVAARRGAQPNDTYEAGMFQECGLLA